MADAAKAKAAKQDKHPFASIHAWWSFSAFMAHGAPGHLHRAGRYDKQTLRLIHRAKGGR